MGLLSPTERHHSQAGNGSNSPCFLQTPNTGPLHSSATNKHSEGDAWHVHSSAVVTEGKTKEVWNATDLLSSSMTRVFKGRECFDLWAVEEAWPDRDCFKYLWPLLTNMSTAICSQGGSGKQSQDQKQYRAILELLMRGRDPCLTPSKLLKQVYHSCFISRRCLFFPSLRLMCFVSQSRQKADRKARIFATALSCLLCWEVVSCP